MDERGRLAMLARLFAAHAPGVPIGIGDDAAVLAAPAGGRLVWTVDEQVEATHFRRTWLSWRELGRRSFMASASDLAAMGALPWCALSALALPDDVGDDALEEIARGQRAAGEAIGAPVVGGNLARSSVLSVTTTLLGTCERAVLRSGAKPGDGLWMAGYVGRAAAGLHVLSQERAADPALGSVVAAWRSPTALVGPGLAMAAVAHAAIDVSDGLARDAGHLADASGAEVVIDEGPLLADVVLVSAAAALGVDPLSLAMHGGEDYALVVAAPVPIADFRRIGEVREGKGVVLRGPLGERPIEPGGFNHFVR